MTEKITLFPTITNSVIKTTSKAEAEASGVYARVYIGFGPDYGDVLGPIEYTLFEGNLVWKLPQMQVFIEGQLSYVPILHGNLGKEIIEIATGAWGRMIEKFQKAEPGSIYRIDRSGVEKLD